MKPAKLLGTLSIIALAGGAGWFGAKYSGAGGRPIDAALAKPANGERRLLYYQSPMHPWIKSDKPGKCTICGMTLVAVHEGDEGFDEKGAGGGARSTISLGSGSEQVLGVATAQVRQAPLIRTLRLSGRIDDDETRHRVLSAYAGGRIEELTVNFVGAEVKLGQKLALLYSPELYTAQQEYVLLARTPANSGHALEAARERLRLLGLAPEQIEALPQAAEVPAFTEIRAPMSGTVVSKDVYEGQYVSTGDPLMSLGDFATMWMLVDVYEQDLAWLRVGQTVEATTPARPGEVFKGTITFIDPNFNEMTRSTSVRVELPNPDRRLPHRAFGEGAVRSELPPALLIPRSAVLDTGSRTVAYVAAGTGRYEQRDLRLGQAGDTEVQVLEGLREGEKVVTQGNLLLDAQAQLTQAAPAQP